MKRTPFVVAAIFAFACVRAQRGCETWPDGSCKDDGLVYAQDLVGTWCQPADNQGRALCLFVDDQQHYTWASFYCHETGTLSGALEFTPVVDYQERSLCWGFDTLYSASVDFTDTGIRVFIDSPDGHTRRVDLEFQE